jgi:hypothetical protein
MPAPLHVMLLTSLGDPGLLGSYGRAFVSLGHRVDYWDFQSAFAGQARLGEVGRRLQNFVLVEPWLKRANRDFVIVVRERQPDLIGVGCTTRVSAGALAQIRASCPASKLVLFWPDPLQNLEVGTVQALPLYDLVATYAQSSIEPLTRLGAKQVAWVPFAADTELFASSPAASDGDASEFACDVGFIANYRPDRETAVVALQKAGVDIRVWGTSAWQTHAEDKGAVRRYWQKRPLFGAEFARATRAFKLALNVIDPTNYPGGNMRFFETLGCGGTLLTSECPELSPEFPEGIAAFYFRSIPHLLERVGELLAPTSPIQAIAEEGQRRALARHRYIDRGRQVLRSLNLAAADS